MGIKKAIAVFVWVFLAGLSVAEDDYLKVLEEYVMGDADKAIESLMPGTEKRFYLRCLQLQKSGQLEKAEDILFQWATAAGFDNYVPISPKYAGRKISSDSGDSRRAEEFNWVLFHKMMTRQAFLYYGNDPERSLKHLMDNILNIDFDDTQTTRREERERVLPSTLDQSKISEKAFREVKEQRLQEGYLAQLAYGDMTDAKTGLLNLSQDAEKREETLEWAKDRMMSKMTVPDLPKLMEWILADLNKEKRGFGDREYHGLLTLAQLKTCLKRYPKLAEQGYFVNEYVKRLLPSKMEGRAGRSRYLKEVIGFSKTLPRSMGMLQLTAIGTTLVENTRAEIFDAALFEAYLKLRKPVLDEDGFPKTIWNSLELKPELALTKISNSIHSQIVDSHLREFVKNDASLARFAPYFDENLLKPIIAESRLLNGIGNATDHFKTLGAERAKALRSRVDLSWAPTNPKTFGETSDVALALDVKNVDELLVNVYELNLKDFLLDNRRYPNVTINVDGIQPTRSKTMPVKAAPIRRIRHTVPLPELEKPGAYLIELVGGDKSCRTLIVKGKLYLKSTVTAAGYRLEVFDEKGKKRTNATVQLGTRTFKSDKSGNVMIPFAQDSVWREVVVVSSGDVHALSSFSHQEESYDLSAQFFTSREGLLTGRKTRVIVRPQLSVSDVRLPASMLKDTCFQVNYLRLDGSELPGTSITDLKLKNHRELVLDVPVPENVQAVSFELMGTIESIDGEATHLSVKSKQFTFNQAVKTKHLKQAFVKATPTGYELHVLGRNGEPFAGVDVAIKATRSNYTHPVELLLQTNTQGIIHLGALSGISRINYAYDSHSESFCLDDDAKSGKIAWMEAPHSQYDYPNHITIKKGDTVTLPFNGPLTRRSVALMKHVDSCFTHDRYDALTAEDGALKVSGLDAGNYTLHLKRHEVNVTILVVEGTVVGDLVLVGDTAYETALPKILRMTEVKETKKDLMIQLASWQRTARVHVIATRFLPTQDATEYFNGYDYPIPSTVDWSKTMAQFSVTKVLDPEYLYVLNRRRTKRYPGNMLSRPGILLNPFDKDTICDPNDLMNPHGAYGGGMGGRRHAVGKYGGSARGRRGQSSWQSYNPVTMDWLESPARIIANQQPDKNGVVRVPKTTFGDCHYLTILAMDDVTATNRRHILEPKKITMRDLRLKEMITPGMRKVWKSSRSVAKAGDALEITKGPQSQTRIIDSTPMLYHYGLRTTPESWRLREFRFLTQWHTMEETIKKQYFSDYVSHELNFFIYEKDRPFFDKVIRPYLLNKRDKTFMDHWLLGDDLSDYTELSRFTSELNTMEKVLLAKRLPAMGSVVKNHLRREMEFGIGRRLDDHQLAAWQEAMGGVDDNAMFDLSDDEFIEEVEMEEIVEIEEEIEEDIPIESLRDDMKGKGFYELSKPIAVYVETHYHKRLLNELDADFVKPSAFWQAYLEHDKKAPFISEFIHQTTQNSAELIFAMAVSDLPLTSKKTTTTDGNRQTVRFSGGAVVYRRSFEDVKASTVKSALFMLQNYYEVGKQGQRAGSAEAPHYVSSFRPGTVYGCQMIVSNPTRTPISIDVMAQIPVGAIPILSGNEEAPADTLIRTVDLGSYETKQYDYQFYFPGLGEFSAYPARALHKDEIVVSCKSSQFTVAIPKTPIIQDEWRELAETGAADAILKYMDTHAMPWQGMRYLTPRLKDKTFYATVIGWFKKNALVSEDVYKYAFRHGDVPTIRDFLRYSRNHEMEEPLQLGPIFHSPLFSIERDRDRTFEHMELDPVINPRAHKINGQRVLADGRIRDRYREALTVMTHKRKLDDADKLELAYHLFLQDRVAEALTLFDTVKRDALVTKLQYDYFKAYSLFYRNDAIAAERMARPYANHPVALWRNRFQTVLDHAQESRMVVGQQKSENPDAPEPKDKNENILHREPTLYASIDGETVKLRHAHMTECSIGIYVMNLEFLFSKNPFITRDNSHFLNVVPSYSAKVKLDKTGFTSVTIPKKYRNDNLIIQISGSGKRVVTTRLTSGLVIFVEENHGQVKVVDKAGKPVIAAYVKVYASTLDGDVTFYKDGYTDLRGRFDYSALNSTAYGTNRINGVKQFALLVATPDKGSVVREAKPPTGVTLEDDDFDLDDEVEVKPSKKIKKRKESDETW